MYRLRVKTVREGLHPTEVVIAVNTIKGQVNLVIDKESLVEELIEVGYPVARREGQMLVELPRETTSGEWRVWVKDDAVEEAVA